MKLRKSEKRSLGTVGLLAYSSGALLFVLSHWVRVATQIGEQRHPMERWVRVFHSVLTYAVVVALGYLLKAHVLPALSSREKKRVSSGLGVLTLFILLLGTALFILYSGENDWISGMALAHSIIGLLCPGLIIVHVFKRRSAAKIQSLELAALRQIRSQGSLGSDLASGSR